MKSFYCRVGFVALVTAAAFGVTSEGQTVSSTILDVDHQSLVSAADLHYDTPVERSEDGLPIGNGRMGTLAWTSPTALKFQINRVDVFSNDSRTRSFIERHSDYCCGVGFVDIDFVDFGDDVFPEERTVQHLSVYDGLLSVEGRGVRVRALAWHDKDVIALSIEDKRPNPAPIKTSLRMLRPAVVRTRSHMARSDFSKQGDRVILRQQFSEGDYYNHSALAAAVIGRSAKVKSVSEDEMVLTAAPGRGTFTVLIGSAASFAKDDDVIAAALGQLDAAAEAGFDGLLEANRDWWGQFWSRSFVHLESEDRVADFVETHYNYFLYLMASTSRGKFPPKFNGMLWTTGGDRREWGSQFWWHNVSSYYQGMLGTNRLRLTDPMFDMYSGMYESGVRAARQQWGSRGLFIPETVWFDGLAELPEMMAAEMRDLYLFRKPWEARSQPFREFARRKPPHSSRWNWKAHGKWVDGRWTFSDKGAGANGHVLHILSSGAKIAFLFWERYQFTQDRDWLRDRAYPMLKGVAEFFRFFPNLKKGRDGKYHIHHVNNHEPVWGAQDTMEELSAMYGVLPLAIRASELLDVDAEPRGAWRELLANLTPLPTNDDPDALDPRNPGTPRVWVNGRKPHAWGDGTNRSYHTIVPAIHYDLCTLETEDARLMQTANDSFESLFPGGINSQTKIDSLDPSPRTAALLGRASDVKILIPSQIGGWGKDDTVRPGQTGSNALRNRMSLVEGPQANDAERLGRALDALQLALLQGVPARPGGDPVMRVFPAWPEGWDAEYTLPVRGGFLTTSAIQRGVVQFVELRSAGGNLCRLRNPWGGGEVVVYRDGAEAEGMAGRLLEFAVKSDETVVLVRKGSSPTEFKRGIERRQP